jgi:lipopolysaccharide export system ATP-binding protein
MESSSKMNNSKMNLRAEGLTRSFKTRKVVQGVSFEIDSGEIVGLLGPNGAGKTTSFYMVVGLLYPDMGRVFLNNDDITELPMHLRAKKGISYLPQSTSVFKKMTVEENLLAIMEITGVPKDKQEEFLEYLLDKFQIGHILYNVGSALSGGERRRVEIARSLIINPKFLLLDEPFAGVDPVTVQEIVQIITKLSKDGLGVLITDHNVRETLDSCHRSYVLSGGKIIAHGTPQEIANNATVREIYLGENFKL